MDASATVREENFAAGKFTGLGIEEKPKRIENAMRIDPECEPGSFENMKGKKMPKLKAEKPKTTLGV